MKPHHNRAKKVYFQLFNLEELTDVRTFTHANLVLLSLVCKSSCWTRADKRVLHVEVSHGCLEALARSVCHTKSLLHRGLKHTRPLWRHRLILKAEPVCRWGLSHY